MANSILTGGSTGSGSSWITALEAPMNPKIREATRAFQTDLPQLLDDAPKQFCVYHGQQRLSIGPDSALLIQECLQHNVPEEEVAVFWISRQQPESEMEVIELDWEEDETGPAMN